jgi:hypothetical protein
MKVKASNAYDKAGLKLTKILVDNIRGSFGRSVPDSLAGEPASLTSDAKQASKPAHLGHAAKLVKLLK